MQAINIPTQLDADLLILEMTENQCLDLIVHNASLSISDCDDNAFTIVSNLFADNVISLDTIKKFSI